MTTTSASDLVALVDSTGTVQQVIVAHPDYKHKGPLKPVVLKDNTVASIGDKFDPKTNSFARPPAKKVDAAELHEEAKWVAMGKLRTETAFKIADTSVRADAKPKTLALLGALAFWGERNTESTDVWVDGMGKETKLTGAQFVDLYLQVIERVSQNDKVLRSVLKDIAAGKSHTSEHVNAAPWPTS